MAGQIPISGKTCLVTGASSGLGKETALGLARAGAMVLLVARDRERGEAAAAEIRQRAPAGEVELFLADLASQSQVRELAAQVLERHQRLDVLINNAAAVNSVRRVTQDGLEATVALNHIAPFLLTHLLQEQLRRAAPSRVVNVTSHVHRWVKAIPWDDLQSERAYQSAAAYNLSKLMNVLFTVELARRWARTGVSANCLHPGWPLKTGLGRESTGMSGAFDKLTKLFAASAEHGARTQLFLATSPDVGSVTGGYFVKCKPTGPSVLARDQEAAARLWQLSAAQCGLGVGVARAGHSNPLADHERTAPPTGQGGSAGGP